MTTFESFGFSPAISKSIHALGYEKPTPIQEQAVPLVLAGHDLMGLAQTGTGKTAAFGLPLVQHLLKDNQRPEPKSAQALILAPTRELANQIADNLRTFTRRTPLKVNVIVGGQSINTQKNKLGRGTNILVATPGRLLDLVERKLLIIDTVNYLVLDEADQMLDMGFIHPLRKIAKLVAQKRQTLLFSATMPKQIEVLSRTFQNDPVRIECSPPGRAADKIRQSVHFVHQRGKADLLKACLSERPNDISLVFARTKHGAEKLMKNLVTSGFPASSIHGNKSQGQRDRAIRALKKGDIRVLVATDVAARGIDIPGVSHVYNYDLPEVPENYVHRIGRTARAGADGEAVAFCAPTENHLLRNIQKLMDIEIRVASGEMGKDEGTKKGRGNGGTRGRNGNGRRSNKQKPRTSNGYGQGSGGKQQRSAKNEDKAPKSGAQTSGGGNNFKKKRRSGNEATTTVSTTASTTSRNGRKRSKTSTSTNCKSSNKCRNTPRGQGPKRRRSKKKSVA